VIQPDWRSDLRSSRFLVAAAMPIVPKATHVGREALETVASSLGIARILARQATAQSVIDPVLPALARLRKRHYTFARRRPDRLTTVRIRHATPQFKALICLRFICL
jgi:hypothetical protein